MNSESARAVVSAVINHHGLQLKSSQSRNEPEPTLDEKQHVLTDLLGRDPSLFLERYGNLLHEDALQLFKSCEAYQIDYEVSWHLKELFSRLNRPTSPAKKNPVVRNRRYNYLQSLIRAGEYFNAENCKKRYPHLYHQYIGQFHEKSASRYDDQTPLSERLLVNMEEDALEERRKEQEIEEQMENNLKVGMAIDRSDKITRLLQSNSSTSTSSSEENDDESSSESELESDNEQLPCLLKQPVECCMEDKEEYRLEFETLMHHKFLNGEDKEFDYSMVDSNVELDLEMVDRDAENKYFDSDEGEV